MLGKTGIVIHREFSTRVRTKAFWISTFLTPLLIVALMVLPPVLSMMYADSEGEALRVMVLDESNLLQGQIDTSKSLVFNIIEGDYKERVAQFKEYDKADVFVYLSVRPAEPAQPEVKIISKKALSLAEESSIVKAIQQRIEEIRLLEAGIREEVLAQSKVKLRAHTLVLSKEGEEKAANSGVLFGIGMFLSFVIYLSIFIYGAQVMRGVIEEKTNRIVEVIISTLRPIELMMGKVLGIGLVGLLQFALWIVLTIVLVQVATFLMPAEWTTAMQNNAQGGGAAMPEASQVAAGSMGAVFQTIMDLNIAQVVFGFLFYFLGGYFLYSSLFAAVGAAVDSESDAQQFTLPVTIPLILAFIMAQIVLNHPDGQLAFWLSMIPLTSPIIMVVRLPYGVPGWELITSMACMVVGFLLVTWLAARIYRIGILSYGKKPSYKDLWKWMIRG
ncbi:MAG: ABC transporter permease [Thermonema sp.]|uniref:ABC transporter permease n=1 Tax=Thermonema sp. TaxID=2231181 RepID=UPI0021DC64A2|nr:ABC transporter permease [Thermonema sp.]GIV38304.1 MAG: ABC transporter permease [Thermonema sp.]